LYRALNQRARTTSSRPRRPAHPPPPPPPAHKKTTTVKRLTSENRLPHLLLYGPPGTGKTSTVLAVARQIYGAKAMPSMTLELNASDDRGIAVVRQEISEFASTRSVFSRQFKLVVLDECDAMTKDAQFALRRGEEGWPPLFFWGGGGLARRARHTRVVSHLVCGSFAASLPRRLVPPRRPPKTQSPPPFPPPPKKTTVIEKYTRNARFCLICNYVSKVIPALQSRCTRFRFAPLSAPDVSARLEHVVAREGVRLGEGGVRALVDLGGGDMRRTLNLLQSCHMAFPTVDADSVYATAGQPRPQDVADCLGWLLNDSFDGAMARIRRLQVERGVALADIVRDLMP
jgi:DNA polymerase III delta prime subunit